MHRLTIRAIAALGIAALAAGPATRALARPSPEQKCQAAKNKAAGNCAACRQNAEAKLATTGDTGKYGTALGKCGSKLTNAWQKAEAKAAKAAATCLDDPLTVGDFQTVIDAHTDNVATALAGGGFTDCSADLATVNAGTAGPADVLAGKTFSSGAALGLTGTMPDNGAVTITPTTTAQAIAAGYHNGAGTVAGDADLVAANIKSGVEIFGVAGTLSGSGSGGAVLKTGQTTAYGTGSDGDLQKGAARSYTDNGDGTITDNTTGLMWEKKSDDGSIDDKDNTYTWGLTSSPYTMNGTMVTTFLATLNGGGGFAGHTDWRIPNLNELQSIANYQNVDPAVSTAFNTACAASCTVTSCSCTQPGDYWSSTTLLLNPAVGRFVGFYDGGFVSAANKSAHQFVRAVRGGS